MTNKRRKYKFIAAVLLVVFSLNTLIGFACSVGIDMGFNRSHHESNSNSPAKTAFNKTGEKTVGCCAHQSSNDSKAAGHKSKQSDRNCCNDGVRKFERLDKSLSEGLKIVAPIISSGLNTTDNYSCNFLVPGIRKDIRQFVRSYHPPIPNIRIAIQSFQI